MGGHKRGHRRSEDLWGTPGGTWHRGASASPTRAVPPKCTARAPATVVAEERPCTACGRLPRGRQARGGAARAPWPAVRCAPRGGLRPASGPRAKPRELPLLRIALHQRADHHFQAAELVPRITSDELPALDPVGVALLPSGACALRCGTRCGQCDHRHVPLWEGERGTSAPGCRERPRSIVTGGECC